MEDSKYYAVYNKISNNYYNPNYKIGLNRDTIYEIMVDGTFPACDGVTFISVENIFQQIGYGTHIAPIKIPKYVKINYNEKTLKHNAKMCIVGDIMEFYNVNTIQMLIDNGANIENSGNLLCWASYFGYLDIIKLIIESSISLDKLKDLDHISRFKSIVTSQDYLRVCDRNNIQITDHFNVCVLIAAKEGHLNVIKYFVEIGENLHEDKYNSCLLMACKMGHLDIVQYYIEKGFDIESNNHYCLILSTIYNRNEVIDYIKQIKFNYSDHIKKCINHVTNGNSKLPPELPGVITVVKYLKKVGVNNHILYQALLTACENGDWLTTRYLIGIGIKPTNICLKIACKNNKFDIVEFITKYSCTKLDINIDNDYCLKQAKRHNNQKMIDYLTNIKN
ncbi:ankyrin repeat protein [Cotonvirus japonicus]|uniref:Ankyrin repeat protein n=1 Tax=Cotonvirus japonicus TaxID=2811091 RepID=A0ABM7NRN0_9VIRU|nr:ankyrin repeat protein [Cotonvirus japonicus]BCS82809.1 ankyrin repeat protein [Cotonvirus japonicus]